MPHNTGTNLYLLGRLKRVKIKKGEHQAEHWGHGRQAGNGHAVLRTVILIKDADIINVLLERILS